MKNLPSFNEFKNNDSLLESAGNDLIFEFNSLERAEPDHTVNEGKLLNGIKNTLSKFFLGSFSKVGMIDDARKVLVDLEIDLIEKKNSLESEIDSIDSQIQDSYKLENREKANALRKDKDLKIKEFEKYTKTQNLKIKKAEDYIKNVIGDNERRVEYYEVGRAEDEIALAELEYKLAKDRADKSELKKYEDAIRSAKEKAEEIAKKMDLDLKSDAEDKRESSKKSEKMESSKEIKKIGRRGKDIISRKNELTKEIADLKSTLERKLKSLQTRSEKKILNQGSIKKYMADLVEISVELDSKKELLKTLEELGRGESEISSKLKKDSEFSKLAERINRTIRESGLKSGTKKTISSVFSKGDKSGEVKVQPEKIKDVISKINK